MLDINAFRDEKSRKIIFESEKNRFKNPLVVEKIFELDKERVSINFQLENINRKLNEIQNDIKTALKKSKNGKIDTEMIEKLKSLRIEPKGKQAELIPRKTELENEIKKLMHSVGNIIEPDVPISKTADGNVVIREYVSKREIITPTKGYAELMNGFTNPEAGANLVGHRGYFLEGKLALLARALTNYAVDFLIQKNYTFIQVPVMMRKSIMSLTSQLSDFDDQLYKVEDDLYLIATSEQPLTALFMDKKLTTHDLPKLYAGESLCFRKEAGAYGKDNAGIFRVHQFNKIEQFVICEPSESNKMLEKLIEISEEFYKSLDLSYRVVLVASGELNDAAAKKYDLEALFPNTGKFRELVSASNCTDYQSRNLNVGFGFPKIGEKQVYVHMLNATLCAIQRTLCCIIENYQDGSKINIPEVLKPYIKCDEIYLD